MTMTHNILNPQQDSDTKLQEVTYEEAVRFGIKINTRKSHQAECPFCHKMNETKGWVEKDGINRWQPFAACDCQESNDYKKEREIEVQYYKDSMEARRKRQEKIFRHGESDIPRIYHDKTFECFITDTPKRLKAYNTAKKYAECFENYAKDGIGLYIEGTNGTGKTHLAMAVSHYVVENYSANVVCVTAGGLLNRIKSAFNDNEVTEEKIINTYSKCGLLVIDDLGKERHTDWSASIFYQIINNRYEQKKPTIITTNYNSKELVKVLTPNGCDTKKAYSIISRLSESSVILTMAWDDIRLGGGNP